MIKNKYWSSHKVPFNSCLILMKLEFCQQIFEKYSITNAMKIHPVGAELFYADGWMDGWMHKHDEANSRFSQFCKRA